MLAYSGCHAILLYKQCVTAPFCRRRTADTRLGAKYADMLTCEHWVLLILLVGGSLFLDSWSWRAVGLAAFLFVVARPLSVLVGLLGSGNSWRICGLAGWVGVRGIGSLYYLMYAIEHGLPEGIALELIHMTLIVVTLSILVHGISVKPLMERFWSRRGRSH